MLMSCWWAWMQRLLKTRSTSLMSAFKGTISEPNVCRRTRREVSAAAKLKGWVVAPSTLYLLRVLRQQVVQQAGVLQPQCRHLHVIVVFLQVERAVGKAKRGTLPLLEPALQALFAVDLENSAGVKKLGSKGLLECIYDSVFCFFVGWLHFLTVHFEAWSLFQI